MRLDHEKARWHRDRLGWTLDTLAEKAEVAKGTVLRAEHGEDVRPSSGRRIARALGVEISDLIPDRPGAIVPKVESRSSPEPALPKVDAPREAGRTLADFLNERCGHAYLALGREEIQALFDRLEGVEDEERKRKELGLTINDEYNTFCSFPRNVTREERFAMRSMIRGAISDVAVKHQLALVESGLWPEYQEELKRIFEVERATLSDEETA
jgi:transcriptional regulator with XRE-family HTH domain